MTERYWEFLEGLTDTAEPSFRPTLQMLFLAYLVVGQFGLLALWKLMAPAGATRRRAGQVVFGLFLLAGQGALLFAWPVLMHLWLTSDPIGRADLVVTLHLGFVLAVLATLVGVLVGWLAGWEWTRNFWFRISQLLAIEIVAGQAVVGLECPLTTLERHLRGGPGYLHELDNASALGRFCNNVLFHEGSRQFFLVVYCSVAVLVLLTWVLAPPRLPWERGSARLEAEGHGPAGGHAEG
ncbi:MAG: DUF2784 family protein [Gemmataceae bacterium]